MRPNEQTHLPAARPTGDCDKPVSNGNQITRPGPVQRLRCTGLGQTHFMFAVLAIRACFAGTPEHRIELGERKVIIFR
jgi:hypothetical protein